jgi:hypothetical protein
MRLNAPVVILDGGIRNNVQFQLQEAGCFPNVRAVKEQWIALAIKSRILQELFSLVNCSQNFEGTYIEFYREEVSNMWDGK